MQVKIKQTSELCRMPERGTPFSNAYDLFAICDMKLAPNQIKLMPLGFCMELPSNHCALVCPRSGKALHLGLTIANSPGIIDQDYRGEMGAILHNVSPKMIHIATGDKIAQMLIVRTDDVEFVKADELSETKRGSGGFGSTKG